ncbi:MAG TPA: hypothetical protein VMM76_24175 [Pirellulaceae bacterium]|nr:hypothetical protein [Pirellulaceae bacterium]
MKPCNYYVAVAIAVSCCGGTLALGFESETDTIDRVVRDWTARRAQYPIVQYLVEGEVTVPKGALNGISDMLNMGGGASEASPSEDSPPEDATYSSSRTYLIDFKQGLVRREHDEMIWEANLRVFNRTMVVTVFDGVSVKSYEPKSENTRTHYDIVKNTPEYNFREGARMYPDPHDSPIFYAHGVPLLTSDIVNDIGASVSSSMLRVRRKRDDIVDLRAGTDEMYSEFQVDLARDSAIVAASFVISGDTTWDVAIEYSRLDGAWLPKSWRTNNFGRDGTPTLTGRFDVKTIDTNIDENVSPSQFQLVPSKNEVVLTNEGHFRVGANGDLVRFDPRAPPSSGFPWTICVLAVGGGLLIAASLFVMRRNKASG